MKRFLRAKREAPDAERLSPMPSAVVVVIVVVVVVGVGTVGIVVQRLVKQASDEANAFVGVIL